MSFGRWIIIGLVALTVHVFAAAALFFGEPESPIGAFDEGAFGVEVGLGTAGGYRDKLAKKKSVAKEPVSEQPKEKEPNKPIEKPQAKAPTKKITALKPPAKLQQVGEKVAAESVVVEEKIAPLEKPRAVEEPKKLAELVTAAAPEEKTLPTKKEVAEDNKRDGESSDGAANGEDTANMSRSTGSASDRSTGGKKGKRHKYFAKIMRHLAEYKTYPPALKKDKIEGVVSVSFLIDEAGNVSDVSVVKSSGNLGLDEAAKTMIYSGAPLPKIPRSLKKNQLRLTIPIEYSLITNKG